MQCPAYRNKLFSWWNSRICTCRDWAWEAWQANKQAAGEPSCPAAYVGQACGKLRSLSGCRSVSRQLAGKVASQNPRNQEKLAIYLLTWLLSVTLMNLHALTERFNSLASALNNKQNILEKKKCHPQPSWIPEPSEREPAQAQDDVSCTCLHCGK